MSDAPNPVPAASRATPTAPLVAFLQREYGLAISSIEEAKRGFYGETWRADTDQGAKFVKLIRQPWHMPRYRASFPIVEYMRKSGIDFISEPVSDARGALCREYQGGVLGVFAFVPGINTEDYPVGRLFSLLAKVYQIDATGISVEEETFGGESWNELLALRAQLRDEPMLALLSAYDKQLAHWGKRLARFSSVCAPDRGDFHLTSGDAGGNVIIQGDKYTLIDWDWVMRAPIERDTWMFMQRREQIEELDAILAQCGIAYRVRRDRLGYYCYFSALYYLCEHLHAFLASRNHEEVKMRYNMVAEYLREGWVYNCTRIADWF